jgi:hypothetical protein
LSWDIFGELLQSTGAEPQISVLIIPSGEAPVDRIASYTRLAQGKEVLKILLRSWETEIFVLAVKNQGTGNSLEPIHR